MTEPDTIEIPAALAHALIDRATAAGDAEICGVLIGASGDAACIDHPIDNRAPRRRDRFEWDIGQQIALFRQVREAGQCFVAFYHSHPRGEAVPSRHDRAGHGYPAVPALIVAPAARARQLRAWRIHTDTCTEQTIRIAPSEASFCRIGDRSLD